MNILYIVPNDPRLTRCGSEQRTNLVWSALKRLGDVYSIYHVGFHTPTLIDANERIASWSLQCENRFIRIIQSAFMRLFEPIMWPYLPDSFIQARMPWKGIKFDVVVTRYVAWTLSSKAWRFGKLIVDIDDLPVESFSTTTQKKYRLRFLGRLARRAVCRWQRQCLRKSVAAWIANPLQAEDVRGVVRCAPLPNLSKMPSADYRINGLQRRQLMFVGQLGWSPNALGVDKFLKEIWPSLNRRFPDLEFVIAGGGCPVGLSDKWRMIRNVRVVGFVEDLDRLYAESLALVVPVYSGAGTCIKVVEGIVHGRQLIATEFAVRGHPYDVLRDVGVIRYSSAKEVVDGLLGLMSLSDSERGVMQERIASIGCQFFGSEKVYGTVRDTVQEVIRI